MLNGISLALIMASICLVVLLAITVIVNRVLIGSEETPKDVLDEIIDAFDLNSSDKFIDLGSGYGSVVLEVYRRAKCRCIGYDISPIPVMVSRIKKAVMFPMRKDISFELVDIFSADLNGSTKVYCYLNKASLEILKRNLAKVVDSGGSVYSYMYAIPSMKEAKIVKLGNGHNLYVYSHSKKEPLREVV